MKPLHRILALGASALLVSGIAFQQQLRITKVTSTSHPPRRVVR